MAKQQRVVIVGGGVIGLLTAFNLATEVGQVTLVDQSAVGQESSWAGHRTFIHSWQSDYSPRQA